MYPTYDSAMTKGFRLAGELELQALQKRIGYRGGAVEPSVQAQYGRRGEMVDTRPYERDVMRACLQALLFHPGVAWFHRMNVGSMEIDDRTIRFAFSGCSDILGQLTHAHGGRSLAVECKRPGESPTDHQAEFLFKVWSAGGCAFVATDVADIFRNIPR